METPPRNAGDVADVGVLTLPASAPVIALIVRDEAGRPLDGVRLMLTEQSTGSRARSLTTGKDGRVLAPRLAAGKTYEVRLVGPGGMSTQTFVARPEVVLVFRPDR